MGRFAKTHDQTSCCWNSEAMATKKVSLLPPPAVATSLLVRDALLGRL